MRLFYAPLLVEIVVDRLTFDRHAIPYKTTAAKLRARVDAAAATFDRHNLEYSPKVVRGAYQVLAQAA